MSDSSRSTAVVTQGVSRSVGSREAISTSIAAVDEAARATAANAQQTKQAGDELMALASQLQRLVDQFKLA